MIKVQNLLIVFQFYYMTWNVLIFREYFISLDSNVIFLCKLPNLLLFSVFTVFENPPKCLISLISHFITLQLHTGLKSQDFSNWGKNFPYFLSDCQTLWWLLRNQSSRRKKLATKLHRKKNRLPETSKRNEKVLFD